MNISLPPVDRERKKNISLQSQAKVNINADPGKSRRQGYCAKGEASSCVQILTRYRQDTGQYVMGRCRTCRSQE